MVTNRKHLLLAFTLTLLTLNSQAQDIISTSPEWAKKAVWYQIFPERFRNGDALNDPKVEDIIGADPQTPPVAWEISKWESDWYEIQPWEKENVGDKMYETLLRRRYGGDIQGIINKLPYLKDLGINAIYINPLFISPSLHKYDGESYHHIDPNFGPDPAGDTQLIRSENVLDTTTWVWTKADELALKMVEKAHELGMRVIFDGVFNHMGYNSFAFEDVRKNQSQSPYKDWFTINSWEDTQKGTTFKYEGWMGVSSLPELKEDSLGITTGPKEYIFNSVSRWMNPKGKGKEFGIDGWRLDVAFCVGHPFWKDFRNHVKSINPEAYLTAELVMEPEKAKPYLAGDEFDGEMNYNFAFVCADFFFAPESQKITPATFDSRLRKLRESYANDVNYVSQNLFGSHDANRIGSHIKNRGIERYGNWGTYYGKSMAVNNKEYITTKPSKEDIELQKLFIIMQMSYVGAPMIYYGDEVGIWGSNDPDCRKPMIWSDIKYQPEFYNADGTKREDGDIVEVNEDLHNFYKRLISIRNKNIPLQIGDFKTLLTDNKKDIYIFERSTSEGQIVVCLNNSTKTQKIEVPEIAIRGFKDLISDKTFSAKRGKVIAEIKPKSGLILKEL